MARWRPIFREEGRLMLWTPSTPYDREEAAKMGKTYREYRAWITPWRQVFYALCLGIACTALIIVIAISKLLT